MVLGYVPVRRLSISTDSCDQHYKGKAEFLRQLKTGNMIYMCVSCYQ
jgi:hypothetical protein